MERIVSAWFGNPITALHRLCIASWVAHGYEPVIYSFQDDIGDLPKGARLADAAEILPEDKIFFRHGKQGAYANFADVFRMELLRRNLGVWCDTDYLALRPFPPVSQQMIGAERGGWPCNAVLWMEEGHPIPAAIVEAFHKGGMSPWTYAKPRLFALWAKLQGRDFTFADFPHAHWGRHALVYYVRKLGLRSKLLPQKSFYLNETYTGELYEPMEFGHIIDDPEVYGLHVFKKFRRAGAPPPKPGSLYHWAHERYADYLK